MQRQKPFVDDVMAKTKQGFIASLGFMALGGFTSLVVLSVQSVGNDPVLGSPESQHVCNIGSVCILQGDPGFRRVDQRWYAASEQCPSNETPVRAGSVTSCETSVRGGQVPTTIAGECWMCVVK